LATYVQLFHDADPTNTELRRTLGAIALTPTGNAQGDYHFLSLSLRLPLSPATAGFHLPMTDTAIARVEALASHENQPLVQRLWPRRRSLAATSPIDDAEYDREFRSPGV
jgi:hypothetical protein